ncbi:multiple sugar transport system ATP-binding protein [Thermosporothrix hazakensis]|jgi:multiple sugar transport system ATP-binding protein|uniref:Multiple sugar transport system ATP-binding protein n=2 Tax=Thermosporothrix TaxID=768650 RepID=A0A326U4M9_THEHA|nr:sn-glycerol-3-phosphate ABC transporter ATP-binding protein UgpC [Thermosporothrix hazakensis]PZW26697.1 multiple sugar transport system ATP-binding protein [Thermosporothrix hazakensis]BBH89419.1 glycerol-3-phosphate ABC transporter ATP-binding protein [Thermosporothrix sp. COM3]GCE47602.1 glycerol-3-phosphate ABC transporter ATP-binding protein [Thermosporothrix hazakensis]
MARVQFQNVYKRFGKVEVVKDVSLDIKDKEFMVFVGPSGCGKSTCLRMVAGLEEPSDGEIYIGDKLVNGVDPKDRDIAMVFQNYALYPHMTVFDNMAFGLKLRHFPKAEIKKRVEEAAGILGLENLLKRKPKELSGGQRQRVALGRAIVREAKVFLMDEPLSNLDAKLRVETRANIIKLHQRIQTTTIYVTHDQVEAMTMGDRIAVLNAGIIQQLGTPQELYDHPANMFVAGFIGTPAMNFFEGAKVVSEGENTHIVLEGVGKIEVPEQYKKQAREAAASGKPLTFGIRPVHLEDARLVGENGATRSSIDATVDVVENLGNELQAYLKSGNKDFIATLDPRANITPGKSIRLYVDSERIHLFDSESQKAYF